MGGLRPIGSEKLEGMDKIRRIMEIARYNESIPQPVNGLEGEYIEPIQNRKYFPSYAQALKKLNLVAKDFNQMYGNEEGMSLFTEQKKKFKLKLPGKKKVEVTEPEGELPQPVATAPVPAVPPMDDMGGAGMPPPDTGALGGEEGLPPPPMDDMGGAGMAPPMDDMGDGEEGLPPPPMDDMGDEELPPMDDMDYEDSEDEGKSKKEGGGTFKVIQKLTGKLAQRIRKYNSEDDMNPNDVKYIINSILSALDVDLLDDDDLEEIISRLEGDFEEESDKEDEDIEDEEMSDEEEPISDEEEGALPPPPPAGGEMTEYDLGEMATLGQAINRRVSSEMAQGLKDMTGEWGEEHTRKGAREPRHNYNHFSHGTFGESKVDKLISKYFTTEKKEIISEQKKKIEKHEKHEKLKETNYMNVKNLSENIRQERMALKYMEKNPISFLVGKTNKGSLVFKEGVINTKITTNGLVI